MKKRIWIVSIFVLSALMLGNIVLSVSAHPGRTDSNGGHYNRSTGEYHYHHGYSAHDHYDMDGDGDIDCPYDFRDRTTSNNSGSKPSYGSNFTTTPATTLPIEPITHTEEVKKVPTWVYCVFGAMLFAILSMASSIKQKNNDLESAANAHRLELRTMKEKYEENLIARRATDVELAQSKEEIRKAKENRSALYTEIGINKKELEKLKNARRMIESAPSNVMFSDSNKPIYWKPSIDKPFGDYTVYINRTSHIYHIDRYCASYYADKAHIFDVINHSRPCKKCAQGAFDFTKAPDWYIPL